MPDTKGEGEIVSFRAEVAVSASSEGLPDLAVSCGRQRGWGSTCKTRPRQADTNPARPLTYYSVSLCWGLHSARHSLRVMKQFPNKTEGKSFISRSALSLTFSRVPWRDRHCSRRWVWCWEPSQVCTLAEHTSPWPWGGPFLGARHHIVYTRRW